MTTAAPRPVPSTFTARCGGFEGSLSELASALRTGELVPAEVTLLRLTREVLAWVQDVAGAPAAFAEVHPELLPTLASVIALKARLMLPQPEGPEATDESLDEPLDDLLEGIEALAELDALVSFLAARRQAREGLMPARPIALDLPRRERRRNPQGSLARLVKAAQNAVRQVEVPLLARERLSLADALGALKAFGRRLRTFTFRGIPAQDWGERTTYFAALLEGVKEGTFSAEQPESYGDIVVVSHVTEA
ncbi:segregation and condensation protein A [Deinococcus navajonensis]|uniref:Segregation and condensation protein A n=1 Tax=Deinococcus navajonensis TaxID=309884 RepID=A0ABV8XTP6_9DEIO